MSLKARRLPRTEALLSMMLNLVRERTKLAPRVTRVLLSATLMLSLLGVVDGAANAQAQTAPSKDPGPPPLVDTPTRNIVSAGPLSTIFVGNDLSAQIAHTGDTTFEVFPPGTSPGDDGTFLVVNNILYAPDFVSHGGTATRSLGTTTPFTPVSQSVVSGSGTAVDPFKVVTIANVGTTGLQITQTDTYIVGQESYRSDVQISNSNAVAQSAILYSALDCFLGDSDFGFGLVVGTAPACTKNPNNTPAGRIEQLLPITPGNAFVETFFDTLWADIGTHNPLPNTCHCTTNEDNSIGISWNINVPAHGQVTYSHITTFSPLGNLPLSTTKTADSSTASAGAGDGYTITIANPNATGATLTSIFDTLPAGFSYVAGSSTGVTTANPSVSGQTLTWTGPFTVPGGGSVSLLFKVTVATTAGTYFNNAGANAADGLTVAPTGDTAPIVVPGTTPPSCALTAVIAGPPKQIKITVQAADGGLASITVLTSTNANTVVPSFAVGTTDPVIVTATKIDQTMGATVVLQAKDSAGNVTTCDPAMVTLNGSPGRPVSKIVTGVAQAESTVSIYNSTPGLKQVDVRVNGRLFKVTRLHDGEVRTIDVAAGLKVGNHNTIVLTPRGSTGSAEVLISDMGKHTAAHHGTTHVVVDREEHQDAAPLD